MKTLPENHVYRIRKNVLWRDVDGEIVLLDTAKSFYFGIGGAGTLIWECLKKGTSVSRILKELEKEYEADEKMLKKDALTFLKQLEKSKIIEKVK